MSRDSTWKVQLEKWINLKVVVDMDGYYVAAGTLLEFGSDFILLSDADMHDLRDSESTHEHYLIKISQYGIPVNRKSILLRLDKVVGVSCVKDLTMH